MKLKVGDIVRLSTHSPLRQVFDNTGIGLVTRIERGIGAHPYEVTFGEASDSPYECVSRLTGVRWINGYELTKVNKTGDNK